MQPGLLSIVGMGRSGSTYLELCVAERFGGLAVGELPGIWGALSRPNMLCSCGEPAKRCPFWANVIRHYPRILDPHLIETMQLMNMQLLPIRRLGTWALLWLRQPFGLLPPQVAQYQDEMRMLHQALLASATEHDYQVVVESSKHPLWYHLALTGGCFEGFAQSDAWRVVRDPRAVVYSLARPKFEQTSAGAQVIQRRYSPSRAIPYWLAMNVGGDIATPRATPIVRYEDLGDESYIAIMEGSGYRRITKESASPGHQLVGNPSRQSTSGQKPFQLDERWKGEQASWGTRLSWKLLRPFLRRYGYE